MNIQTVPHGAALAVAERLRRRSRDRCEHGGASPGPHRYVAYALGKDTPMTRPVRPPSAGRMIAISEVGGLHHRYDRVAA